MPKLINRNPKLSKLNKYAVVYYHGKIHYLGHHGTPEALLAYNRFCAEIQTNPTLSRPCEVKNVTICELTAAFLDHEKANNDTANYSVNRTIVLDFLDKLYGNGTLVDDFTPRCLKRVRDEMIRSRRFCRGIVNRHTSRIVSIFRWGVENELVQATTWNALKAVQSLSKGHPGTYDNEVREPVPDDVIRKTLPFMPLTLQAMVKVQRLTGMRPSEVFNMKVGEIIKDADTELWHYVKKDHKTERFIGKKVIPLGKPEQTLITPYLEGKKPENAVFSPRVAMQERNVEKRANRKTKLTPSQKAREKSRATNPPRFSEFYNQYSYRQAIKYAIDKANRVLSDGECAIPHWFPYQLRHSASTATELEHSDEDAQAMLGHKNVNMTKRYSKTQLKRRETLALNRRNPFETDGDES